MSRNLMVLFLVAIICVTVMSNPSLKQYKPLPPPLPPSPKHCEPKPLPPPPSPSPPPKHWKPTPSPTPHPPPLPPPKHCKPTPPPPPPPSPPPPPPPKCPKNEIYKTCGTACQPSCQKPKPICNLLCVKGCFCKNGLLRNKWGKCVKPYNC
ncbi:anther-specific proline-rich protein APG-like [Camponotus floridanus]|uniref:anther-specific proline-rich protein APG-like n=1 Tax=Camponotus floridanus TaxID=104421 RepID=UPI000DC6CF93|nr:anther-specific proline-rich protein APG-like [Camponotus floridanus]